MSEKWRFATKAVRGGQRPDPTTGAITTPIYQTATYVLDDIGKDKGFDYSRTNTPTRKVLEQNLAILEGGKDAVAFASGLAAIDALMHTLKKGDHVLACDDLYGGTSRMFTQILTRCGLQFDFVDMTEPTHVAEHIKDSTKYIFIETPTNPLLKLIDIKAVSEVARENSVPLVVDNTFMTPYFQRPFELGGDIIIHSLTKYLSGHNDVVGGAFISNIDELNEQMRFLVMAVGATLGPFDSWLTLRGIKTLALRMRQHDRNARAIAKFLEDHPKVGRVIYPGLETHPQHALAETQMSGFGGMISFELDSLEAAKKFVKNLSLWSLAESLGGVESLVTHPVTMTHTSLSREQRERLGITDGLVRLSVGIEDVEDLIEDIEQALQCV